MPGDHLAPRNLHHRSEWAGNLHAIAKMMKVLSNDETQGEDHDDPWEVSGFSAPCAVQWRGMGSVRSRVMWPHYFPNLPLGQPATMGVVTVRRKKILTPPNSIKSLHDNLDFGLKMAHESHDGVPPH